MKTISLIIPFQDGEDERGFIIVARPTLRSVINSIRKIIDDPEVCYVIYMKLISVEGSSIHYGDTSIPIRHWICEGKSRYEAAVKAVRYRK